MTGDQEPPFLAPTIWHCFFIFYRFAFLWTVTNWEQFGAVVTAAVLFIGDNHWGNEMGAHLSER